MKKILLLAFVASFLVAVRVAPAADAAAGPASLATTYACDSSFGSGDAEVTVSVRLPRAVASGSEVAQRRIGVRLVVPDRFVAAMRQFGVRSVEGTASKAALRVGSERVALQGLRIPRTDVPATGSLALRGTGRVAAFTAPAPGSYPVRVPQGLVADITAYFTSTSADVSLTCAVAPGAPTRLGTLRVRG